ncbi:MAG: type IX secretion system protein PorQ [Bacteroidota bacterium]
MKKIALGLCILALLCLTEVSAQIGGRHVYDFLTLSPSARVVALGGVNISTLDDDVNLAAQNPGLLNDSMHRQATLSWSNYLTDIKYGYAAYAHTFEKIGTVHMGVQFLDYGTLQGADVFGNLTGEFSAGEYAVYIGAARSYKRFSYGANLKFISSTLGPGYTSAGVALDLGGSYYSKSRLFSAGLVVKNMGTQLSTYIGNANREPLPFEIQAGISNKLKYMPLRFSITASNLDQFDLIYEDPNAEPVFDLAGNEVPPKDQTIDGIFRHFVFGTEFLLGRNLRLRGGYNHLRRRELASENRGGLTGFSMGIGIRVKRIAFDYGFSSYGVNSRFQAHQFSLAYNLKKAEEG